MNKLIAMLLAFFPVLAAADSTGSLSFTPPASDYSVVFLGNIFGIVDGVLHGTGSQIMGAMFSVFNAAVLALGGLVIMYTLLVSTMNTAHEGQMLGQKWSSIWIPLRATMGLALLIPKASGYCLMQIFVMWVVVQGVGAADKVWDAALSYLNRGGAIIQAQMDPTTALLSSDTSGVPDGAQIILAGQVCMIGLQSQLQTQLQNYQNQAQSKTGPCGITPDEVMGEFCGSTVPNFVNSVNFVDIQNKSPKSAKYKVPMPNIDSGSPYAFLNGICGTLTWNAFPKKSISLVKANIPALTPDDLQTASMSRVIAMQQMYMDLAAIAQIMVNNDPLIGPQKLQNLTPTNKPNLPAFATQQFGVPETAAGTICADSTTPLCILWGGDSLYPDSAPLFNGTEFQGAIQDYNGIMLPTLNLVAQANNGVSAQNSRAFIEAASTQGWIMAGSYFFNLVNINVQASAANSGNLVDHNTGLNNSTFDPSAVVSAFTKGGAACNSSSQYVNLCTWFQNNMLLVNPIKQLIDGSGAMTSLIRPKLAGTIPRDVSSGIKSLTVYGFTNNATILQLPGQPGMKPLAFAGKLNVKINYQQYYLPTIDFDCGSIDLGLTSPCVGADFGNLFYNDIFVWMYNTFLTMFGKFIDQVLMAFLELPLEGMAAIFAYGLQIIDTPGVNPVVALATMGTYYINFAASLWLTLVEMSIVASLIPIFGVFIFALISMTMPILMAWLGIMLQIGFTTAYYVPILPYMIFTFGSISWVMAVIEAMVAAPIVALGVTHPEGHDAFGKGEQAIMILMNVFLRPAMMIIGYISAIALTYVSVWIINAGFDNAIVFIQGNNLYGIGNTGTVTAPGVGSAIRGGYVNWAGIFAYFFSILVYTMMYLTVVQKAFTLIAVLPDKILRWIGGQQESYGADTAQWGQEVQGKVSEAGKETAAGQSQMDKQLTAAASDIGGSGKKKGGGKSNAEGSGNPESKSTGDLAG